MVRIKRLICPHQRDKILRLAQIDDVVGAARQHMNGLRLLAPHLKFQHLITADAALLNQGVACNNNEKLPLGIVPVLALRDAGLSVKLPRASSFFFSAKQTFSLGR